MREIGIKELFEAMHPSQLSGAYQVMLREVEVDRIEFPVFFKNQGVLVADVFDGITPSTRMEPVKYATIYIFGTKRPYDKLRTFMDQNYDVQLDEHDFGVTTLMDDGRYPRLPTSSPPDVEQVHQRMQQAMTKAKVV